MLGLMVVLPEQAPVLLQAAAIEAVLLPVAQRAAAVGQGAGGWQLGLTRQTAMLQGSCIVNKCQQLESTLSGQAAPVRMLLILVLVPEYTGYMIFHIAAVACALMLDLASPRGSSPLQKHIVLQGCFTSGKAWLSALQMLVQAADATLCLQQLL